MFGRKKAKDCGRNSDVEASTENCSSKKQTRGCSGKKTTSTKSCK